MKKFNIFQLNFDDFISQIQVFGMPKFVSKQVYEWVMQKYVINFDSMTNISKVNRQKLEDNFYIADLKIAEVLESADYQSKKYIFSTHDGYQIEAVVIRSMNRSTLCISTQVGCSLKCRFCVTGTMGCQRNLTVSEIVSQLLLIKNDGEPISHLVFMGMGEPLLNLEAVLNAIKWFSADFGFNISKRRIMVSTSGIIKSIEYLIKNKITLDLALSVGSAIPYKRQILMPVETKNPLLTISSLLKDYLALHNRLLTLEYTLLANQNDGEEDIRALVNLAKYLHAKVNLINFNPHPKLDYLPVSEKKIATIKAQLEQADVLVTIRVSKGQDIGAACGQLGN